MTPEDEAVLEVEALVSDTYGWFLKWLPSWLGKKLSPKRSNTFAKRVVGILQKYHEAKNKSQP